MVREMFALPSFTAPMPDRKRLHACCHAPLRQCGRIFVCLEMRVKMRAIFVRLGALFAEPGPVLVPVVKT